ncbi:50S ribosomal protein L32 [bacterium]|nr:50S ribosomal protein L32 [candidate division CSSED10-310 bacterium]
MPVPKRHKTHSKVKMASANKGLKTRSLSVCPQCQEPKLPHRVCPNCGYYKDKQVLAIEEE